MYLFQDFFTVKIAVKGKNTTRKQRAVKLNKAGYPPEFSWPTCVSLLFSFTEQL